jgi:Cu/Ag efflux protein CusF
MACVQAWAAECGKDAMKKALISLVPALAILGWSGPASAETERGEIDSIDKDDRTVTIDGVTYEVAEGVSMSDLDEGDNVSVTVEEEDGENVITDIDSD